MEDKSSKRLINSEFRAFLKDSRNKSPGGGSLWRIVISPAKRHATLLHSSLYVIGFKRALNFGEAQVPKVVKIGVAA
jgi:hypothetical protein